MNTSKAKHTKSTKLRRVPHLRNYIIDLIDNNQDIKRLCRYYTTTPTLDKGMTYDGKLIDQPDLVDSLTSDLPHDRESQIGTKKRVLFDSLFGGEVLSERQISIFVYSPKSTFNPNMVTGRTGYGTEFVVGKHFFTIDIVYPKEINNIEMGTTDRAMEIACEILDMIDGEYVQGDIRKTVGDCQFRIEGEFLNARLSTADYMLLSIPVWINVIGSRVNASKIGDNYYA